MGASRTRKRENDTGYRSHRLGSARRRKPGGAGRRAVGALVDNAAALRLYGGTEIEVPRSLSTGARPTGMINLGLALIECGALDPNTAALTMGEAVEAVQKALQAYFAGLDAGGEFSFSVSATIEDDKLVLDLSPVDSGILLAPALALE